ncbi:hypothetical protein E2C01_089093 [Portunus trituberculatus]|uniref:Uncharacterized protein n=1 Tax=Portunus trituberculatus TaxID=210409 RepID=A0A5B7JH66_PORTR|nr:hypothetical protein [Portunus trituberculatus]
MTTRASYIQLLVLHTTVTGASVPH